MIVISNGSVKKEVTRGAYESFYKPLGYSIINKKEEQHITREVNNLHKNMEVFNENKVNKDNKETEKIDNIKKR